MGDFKYWLRIFVIPLFILSQIGCNLAVNPTKSLRQEIVLSDWRFQINDHYGADSVNYNDDSWQKITIPHDWGVRYPFSSENQNQWNNGGLQAGVAWYRCIFFLDPKIKGKVVDLVFEGLNRKMQVWINGHPVSIHTNGNVPLRYIISPYVQVGSNLITLRVDHNDRRLDGEFDGSGINRKVYAEIHAEQYVSPTSITIKTVEINADNARLEAECELYNQDSSKEMKVLLRHTVLDKQHAKILELDQDVVLAPLDSKSNQSSFTINSPRLWGIDSTSQYTLLTSVYVDSKLKDLVTTTFGIRKVELLEGNKELIINNKKIELKGVKLNQSFGPLGTAVPDGLNLYRIKKLKSLGYNAIQTVDRPFSSNFYSMCDSLGMIVFSQALSKAYPADLNDSLDMSAVKKYYNNHPSIIQWVDGIELFSNTAYDFLSSSSWPLRLDTSGVLDACGFSKTERVVDSTKGRPTYIKMEVLNPEDLSSGGILLVRVGVADKKDNWLDEGNFKVSYMVDPGAKVQIIGIENGDPSDLSPFSDRKKNLYRGKSILIIKLPDEIIKKSSNTLTAVADGIIEGHIMLY